MASSTHQGFLFPAEEGSDLADGTVVINGCCRIETRGGYRVVSVRGLVLAHYPVGDRMGEAYARVSLVEQGWALQTEVATAFDVDVRTVRRDQRRFESGGLIALGRSAGCPKGTPRLPPSRAKIVSRWKAEGRSNREIARRLGVTEGAVRKLARRLGWKPLERQKLLFDQESKGADPNLSAAGSATGSGGGESAGLPPEDSPRRADPNLSAAGSAMESGAGESAVPPPEGLPRPADLNLSAAGSATGSGGGESAGLPPEGSPRSADPNLSAAGSEAPDPLPVSLDRDPRDRTVDRVMACLGLLDDAAPLFGPATQVPGAGWLLAIPALVESGVFAIAERIFVSIGPAFYGVRTTLMTLLAIALLRIKRPEGLKEQSPGALGRVLGLDRAPEVKTLRRKLARLAVAGRATEFGQALAQHRVQTRGHAMGFLYVDGHVRAYHGKRLLPKAHLARMRLAMPATTDYWVGDAEGEPLFVVTAEANEGLVQMLPGVLDEVRALTGDRRVTVVFDRGGWSPKLFHRLLTSGFDVLTYRKGKSPQLPASRFSNHEVEFDGRPLRYRLADTGTYLGYGPPHARKRIHLRQVTRLSDDGHQTQIITSRCDLSAAEIAHRMFERWRQENFFKYLREEYALDALIDYGVEPADAWREVPNPRRKELNAEMRKAYVELHLLAAEYGVQAFTNVESARRTMRGFKIANAPLARRLEAAIEKLETIEQERRSVPARVPVQQLTNEDIVKLRVERKHLADLVKMVAFQAESDLVRLVAPHYQRAEQEGRTLVQSALATTGDIAVAGDDLWVTLEPLSSPHRTHALVALCEVLNESATRFPGSKLRLRFEVKPPPETCPAFPGPRSNTTDQEA